MAKMHVVKKARQSKVQKSCMTCRKPIEPGQAYKWSEHRAFPQFRYWHAGCQVLRSQQSSSKMGPIWDAIDQFNPNNAETLEDLQSMVEEIAGIAEEVRDDYQEGLDAMPEGLQESAYETQEKIESLDSYVSDLQNWEPEEYDADEEADEEDHLQEQRDAAQELINQFDY